MEPRSVTAMDSGGDGSPLQKRWLAGGRVAGVVLEGGDALSILDPEGMQPVELFVFAGDGRPAPGLLGLDAGSAVSSSLSTWLEDGGESADVATLLRAHGADPAARGVILGAGESPPETVLGFTARERALVCIAAVGGGRVLEGGVPPTDIELRIRRVRPGTEPLPPPLAEPRAEIRIGAGTAEAYRVEAGEYIQIIDVEGRQCSDFLAFEAADLSGGVESGLDPTTTRTLLGSTYPMPGLYSKYFDDKMLPLVEVVRDTVGRHDTFMLACNAKYYEDMGYPGHPNCSDNFNAALAPYAVKPRKGWPAINFFYNTQTDHTGAVGLDEPWSRPGDYVLLRALTDLVCASSSCADDIDAANAWNPTDIHLRIYGREHDFSKGIATRMTPDAQPKLTRETAFHPRTSQLTRHFTEYRGYWLPECFSTHGPVEEYWACRERAAIMDLSPLRKFEVIGPDAEALLQATFTRDVARLAVGQVAYGAMCYEHGGMLDDGTVFRLGQTNFRWVCGDEYAGQWLREQAARRGLKVWVKSSTDHLHNFAVQGPKSRDILREVIWTPPTQPDLVELKWFRFAVGRIGGPEGPAVLVSRTGYTGELGYEVWCHPGDGPAVWDAVVAAGTAYDMVPLGLAALDMLRIEAGLAFAGYEFCDQTDPFEAGIGFSVADKTAEFVGKAVLAERKAHPRRKLVGLSLGGNDAVGHGDAVYAGRAQVGVVTSATYSPGFERWIALARVDTVHAESGKTLEVGKLDGHQKRLPATVVRFPHYDPDKTRVRA